MHRWFESPPGRYLLAWEQARIDEAVADMFGYHSLQVGMPLMDGLQATVNIRHWNKADAKTVPIIAMTANAFDVDVEKSRAAGMNAHLAKPIEPELLYRTLYHLLYKQEE